MSRKRKAFAVPEPGPEDLADLRAISERALSRSADALLVGGNSVQLAIDGHENFKLWLAAIEKARHCIYLENYIIANDRIGRSFSGALAAKARQGIVVRVIYDWLGSWRLPAAFWEPLQAAGGKVLAYNPFRIWSPIRFLVRDHRKTLVVDGYKGFISGVCIAEDWLGNPARGIEAWRDTGVAIAGPAVRDMARAFCSLWAECTGTLPEQEFEPGQASAKSGKVDVRIIATTPRNLNLYRLDLMIAAMARRRLWLADAYFAGGGAYVLALQAAARDGVDVRLLVPGGSDLPWLKSLSTAGYRPLLEAGVRIYEWNGSMMHAKTALADERWARVGSTNLNLASWMTNYEMDIAIENREIVSEMAALYLSDLEHSTEIILRQRRQIRLNPPLERSAPGRGHLTRATAGAIRLTRNINTALIRQRQLGGAESRLLAMLASAIALSAAIAWLFPASTGRLLGGLLGWASLLLFIKAFKNRKPERGSQSLK